MNTRPAPDQVARLPTLVPYLHAHGQFRLDEAARALGVEPTAVRRPQVPVHVRLASRLPRRPDRRRHRCAPGATVSVRTRDRGVERRLPGAAAAAEPDRGVAVIVALKALRNGRRTTPVRVVDRALASWRRRPPRDQHRGAPAASIDPGDGAADTDLALLASQACRRRWSDAAAGAAERLRAELRRAVRPGGRPGAGGDDGAWKNTGTSTAWCHSAEAPRLFRLDRIDHADVLDDPVETPQEGPSDGDGIFSQSTDVTPVTLLLEPEARWMTSYYLVEEIREVGQDRMEVGAARRRRALG